MRFVTGVYFSVFNKGHSSCCGSPSHRRTGRCHYRPSQLRWALAIKILFTVPMYPVQIKNGNSVPMRSDSISTMGTAFPRVPPRNDLWLGRYKWTHGRPFSSPNSRTCSSTSIKARARGWYNEMPSLRDVTVWRRRPTVHYHIVGAGGDVGRSVTLSQVNICMSTTVKIVRSSGHFVVADDVMMTESSVTVVKATRAMKPRL